MACLGLGKLIKPKWFWKMMTVTNTPKGRKAVHTLIRRVWARRLSRAVELGKNDIKGSFRSISKDGY